MCGSECYLVQSHQVAQPPDLSMSAYCVAGPDSAGCYRYIVNSFWFWYVPHVAQDNPPDRQTSLDENERGNCS